MAKKGFPGVSHQDMDMQSNRVSIGEYCFNEFLKLKHQLNKVSVCVAASLSVEKENLRKLHKKDCKTKLYKEY